MKPLLVGIAGTGFGMRTHAAAFAVQADVTIAAVWSRTAAHAEAAAAPLGARPYTELTRMLEDEQLGLLTIASPPHLHHAMAMQALDHGIPFVIEKPLGLSLNEATEIAGRALATGTFATVAYEFRYAPSRKLITEMVRSGRLGDIRIVVATEFSPLLASAETRFEPWVTDAALGGGIHGSHTLDFLLNLLGSVSAVSATERTFVKERRRSGMSYTASASDALVTSLEFACGAIGVLAISPAMAHGGRTLELRGGLGTLLLIDESRLLFAETGDELSEIWSDDHIQASRASVHGDYSLIDLCFGRFAEDVVRTLRTASSGGTSVLPTLAEALRVESVLDAVRRSAREGVRVTVETRRAAPESHEV